MKILYVTVAVPPVKGGSVIITENLVQQFTADEMVVLGANHIFSSRKGNEVKSNGVRYYYQRTEVNIKGRGDRFFVPIRYLFFPFLVWRICRVYRKENCNYILSNFPDIYYCYAAYLASRILKVRFSSYFHNTYLENRPKGYMHFFAKRWQPRIFSHSENIFVMSDGMKNYYEKKYSSQYKFVTLPHSHNKQRMSLKQPMPELKPPYKLVFIGNFNESNIDATRRVVDAIKHDEKYQFFFYTPVPNFLLKLRGIDVDHITNKGYIDDRYLVDELQKYDICILTHGFTGGYTDVEYKTIFPTRTISFLLSGKVIMAHSPAYSFLNDFIKQHKCACLVENTSEDEIRAALETIATNGFIRHELISNAQSAAWQFEGKTVVAKLRQHITSTR